MLQVFRVITTKITTLWLDLLVMRMHKKRLQESYEKIDNFFPIKQKWYQSITQSFVSMDPDLGILQNHTP